MPHTMRGVFRSSLLLFWVVMLVSAAGPSYEDVMRHLEKMRAEQKGMMNVAPAEGEHLKGLVTQLGAKRVLEIGTSNGYSGIWLALGLRETGGKLITLDIDEGRYRLAQENFKATRVAPLIDSRLTDALKELPQLDGPFDLVFIDAWKADYPKYLEIILSKVRSGGIVAAHNVDSHREELADFIETVKNHPELETQFVRKGRAGLSVSVKK